MNELGLTENVLMPENLTCRASRNAVMLLLGLTLSSGCSTPASTIANTDPPNTLTTAEQEGGWELLFDGVSFDGWRGLGRDEIPDGHWVIEDGTIRKVASGDVPTAPDGQPLEGGDILTTEVYDDFELYLEWMVSPGGNSGIKYNVSEDMSMSSAPKHAALGFEYQILDDDRHPDALNGPTRTAAALYDMIPPDGDKTLRRVGTFNQSRVVFSGNRGEHWLNGKLVLRYDLSSTEFDSLLARSKYHDVDGFATRRRGHVVLQDHGDDVWFRSIKIRRL